MRSYGERTGFDISHERIDCREGEIREGVNVPGDEKGCAAVVQEPYRKVKDIKCGEGERRLVLLSTKSGLDVENNLIRG